MVRSHILYLILLLNFPSFQLMAQSAPFACWSTILLNLRVKTKWTSITDIGFRSVSRDIIPYQHFFRSGLRYNLDPNWNITSGIAFFSTKTSFLKENHEYGHEFRLWTDFSRLSLRTRKFIMNHRVRIERRFFDATSTRLSFNSFRFQYRLLSGVQFNSKFNFQTGPEIFESLIRQKFSLDQIRWYSILGILPGKGYGISLGYFFVYRKAYDQNIFAITLSKNLQLYEHHH